MTIKHDDQTSRSAMAGLDAPEVVSVEACHAAVIALVVPRADLPKVMRPAIGEMRDVLQRQGITPASRLFAHHVRLDGATFDLEVGFMIEGDVQAEGRVRPGELPAATVARAAYKGPYEGLHAAWNALQRWTDSQCHRRAGHIWEVYARGPDDSPNPADWRTDLYQPLA